MGPGRKPRRPVFSQQGSYQITEDKEEKKPATTAEKSQGTAKKDDAAPKEKGMYEESDSDEEKVCFILIWAGVSVYLDPWAN